MKFNATRIYCFIEQYESQITNTLGATISLYLIRLYFNNKDTENFGQLTKEEEEKLKGSNRRISRALRFSKSNVDKLRGGGSYPINAKLIATKVATITVNAAKDGSIHALALIIGCKIHPKGENFIKTICFGGNTNALINEIANNLQKNRITIIKRLITNKEIRNSVNSILLELEFIKEPLSQMQLLRLAACSISMFEVPIVEGIIIATRGITLMFVTKKIKQAIISELSGEIVKSIILGLIGILANSDGRATYGVEIAEICKLKEAMTKAPIRGGIGAPQSSVATNILIPMFDDDIIGFIEINPIVEKLTGSPLFNNPLINYLPKFNVDYVIERLAMGNDISKLPKDHIINLW